MRGLAGPVPHAAGAALRGTAIAGLACPEDKGQLAVRSAGPRTAGFLVLGLRTGATDGPRAHTHDQHTPPPAPPASAPAPAPAPTASGGHDAGV